MIYANQGLLTNIVLYLSIAAAVLAIPAALVEFKLKRDKKQTGVLVAPCVCSAVFALGVLYLYMNVRAVYYLVGLGVLLAALLVILLLAKAFFSKKGQPSGGTAFTVLAGVSLLLLAVYFAI